MNTTDLRTGEGWLNLMADVATPLEALEATLQAWQAEEAVLVPYAATEMIPAPMPEKAHWTAKYFFLQVSHARRNFSAERAQHLLRVRSHLEQLGAAGFVKQVGITPLAKDEANAAAAAAAFSPSPSLARALAANDAGIIRAALVLELADARLSGAYLRTAMACAADQNSAVFVPFEEGRFKASLNSSRGTWCAEYHDDQVVFLDANFSIERFLHVVDIREHLRQQGAAGFVPVVTAPLATTLPAWAGSMDTARSARHSDALRGDAHTDTRPSWAERIARLLAAGVAALAAYIRGERR